MKIQGPWRKLSGCVFERIDGTRIHTQGLLRYSNGDTIRCSNISHYSRIQGSVRRGLMLWANEIVPMEGQNA